MQNKKILFLDACISRSESSRTRALCDTFISEYKKRKRNIAIDTFEINEKTVFPMTRQTLVIRDDLIKNNDFENPVFYLAGQFSKADLIIIGAPYWDLSFPALLKIYIENIMVTNLTFKYTAKGIEGLCKAKKLIYITSAGGYINDLNLGFDYVKAIAHMLGIPDVRFIYAEGLDIQENNADIIMDKALNDIKANISDFIL